MIKLTRRTGFYNSWFDYYIELDGKRITRISANQKRELHLPNSPCQLKLKKEFQRGTQIEVSDGDHLIIKRNQWSYIMQMLYVINVTIVPTLNYIDSSNNIPTQLKLMIWIALWVIYLILYITLPTLSIIKKEIQ